MEDYNKIIESLGIHYVSISKRMLLQPVSVKSYHDLNNTMCFLQNGNMQFGEDNEELQSSDILFIPAGKTTDLSLEIILAISDLL